MFQPTYRSTLGEPRIQKAAATRAGPCARRFPTVGPWRRFAVSSVDARAEVGPCRAGADRSCVPARVQR
jgi:hypothetical protein